jgi:hypothetical protein
MGKARKQTQCKLSTLKTRTLDRDKGRRVSCDAVRGGAVVKRSVIQDIGVKYTM